MNRYMKCLDYLALTIAESVVMHGDDEHEAVELALNKGHDLSLRVGGESPGWWTVVSDFYISDDDKPLFRDMVRKEIAEIKAMTGET